MVERYCNKCIHECKQLDGTKVVWCPKFEKIKDKGKSNGKKKGKKIS